jgi:hypothetical protein
MRAVASRSVTSFHDAPGAAKTAGVVIPSGFIKEAANLVVVGLDCLATEGH